MAGVKEAEAGFLGLNVSILAAGVGIAGFVALGKAAVDVTEAHDQAIGDLQQAADTAGISFERTNFMLEQFIKLNQASIPDNNQAIETYAALLRATGSQQKALDGLNVVMNLAAINGKDWATNQAAVIAGLQGTGKGLIQLGISIPALKADQKSAADSAKELVAAQKALPVAADAVRVANEGLTKAHDAVTRAQINYTDAVRKHGVHSHEAIKAALALKDANISLHDKEIALTDATDKYSEAQKRVKTATDDQKTAANLQSQVLEQLNLKTKDGAAHLSEFQKQQNLLNGTWQEFAEKIGPPLLIVEGKLIEALTTLVGLASLWVTLLGEIPALIDAVGKASGLEALANALGSLGGSGKAPPRAPGHRAAGGPVWAGGAYTVGEHGPETLVMGSQGGTIIPNGGGATIVHNYITIDRGAYMDGPSVDRLANILAQRLTYATGR